MAQVVCQGSGNGPYPPYTWTVSGSNDGLYVARGLSSGGVVAWCGTFITDFSCAVGSPSPIGSNYYDKTCPSVPGYSCPSGQGWTLSGQNCTRPACAEGTERQTDGSCAIVCAADEISTVYGTCVPRCTAGEAQWEDARSYSGSGDLPATFCNAGCQLSSDGLFAGYGSGSWWAHGVAKQTGVMCGDAAPADDPGQTLDGTPEVPMHDKDTPEQKCIDSGQGFGTANGVVVCTGPVASTKKTEVKTEVDKPAGGPEKTTTTTTVTVCNDKGSCTTTTNSSVTQGGSGPGGTGEGSTTSAGDGKEETESQSEFCKKNPNDKQCKTALQGLPAGTGSGSGSGEGGSGTGTGDLYGKGDRTVAEVLAEFKAAVSAAPVVSAASNYLSATIPAGSCSGLAVTVNVMGNAWTFDPGDVLCGSFAASVYAVLGIGVMLAAGWVAFRIAIL